MSMPRGFWPNGNNGYGSRHIYDTAPFYLWDPIRKVPRDPTREELVWLVQKYGMLAHGRHEYLSLVVERLPRPLPLTVGGIPVVFEVKQKRVPFSPLNPPIPNSATPPGFSSYGLIPQMWTKAKKDIFTGRVIGGGTVLPVSPYMQASPEHVQMVIEILRREGADFVAVTFAFGHGIVELRPGSQQRVQHQYVKRQLACLPWGIAGWRMIYHKGDRCFLGDVRLLVSCWSRTDVHEVGTWSVVGDAISGPIPAMCEGRRFVEMWPGSFDRGVFEMQDVYRAVAEEVSDLQGGGGNGHLRPRL